MAAGCSSGPRARSIALPVETLQASSQATEEESLIYESDSFPQEWWSLFQDQQLTDFLQIAFTNYPTLQEAQVAIAQAAAQAELIRANLYPNLLWTTDVSRQKLSETGLAFPEQKGAAGGVSPPLPSGGIDGIPVYFTQYETELNLTYDLDLWKKNRNALKAALGKVYASRADAWYARLQLGIALAQVYYGLQIDYSRRELALEEVQNKQSYMDAVQKRLEGNIDNETDLAQAHYNLALTKKALLQLEIDIVVKENQLKTYLANQFDESVYNIKIAKQSLPVVPLPKNLPLHLIARRPDIASQLWLIYSAGRDIQVAKAGFYPDFNLTAFLGFQTLHLHQLFLGKSSNYNIDPAFSLPIFDGGRLKANLRNSEVNYDRAIYQYNYLILKATREVLDGLALVKNSEKQFATASELRKYQEKLHALTQLRVSGNLKSTLESLTTEGSALSSKDEEIVALGSLFQSILLLIKALGGGYGPC